MSAVEVNHIVKSYVDKLAVDNLSFSIAQNEIFGLIGPNGAGKTTTIRMIMDIIKPDSGEVIVFGEKLSEVSKNRLGYLPEERGLYKKLTVMESIIYLASLKNMDRSSIEEKADKLLKQTGMLPYKNKRIEKLSKGMGQIIQLIVTIIHNPELVIFDEPFSSLDPINTELIKNLLVDLRNQGKAVILSTHQINQVEELCDRVLMIDHGHNVLYGSLSEIKARYKTNTVIINFEGELGQIPGVIKKRAHKDSTELVLDKNTTPEQILKRLLDIGLIINRFEVSIPSLNEIFVEVVSENQK
ncbi:MAG: ATP-binding cassette domain-containing protein [Actinomycetota bacterium]